jgi:hypothetical protein
MIQYCNYDIKGTLTVTGNATFSSNVITPNVFTENVYITSGGTNSTNRIDNDGTQLYITYGGTSSRALEILNSNGNATFAGTATATSFISSTDSGININGLTMTRVAANSAIRVSDGLETLGLLRSYAGLNVATTGTFGGDITVSGGDITLGGTGRIQGVDTVSANTDAANKLYVDNAITTATGAYLPLAGGTMSGNIGMGNNNITGVNEIKANGDVKLNTSTGEHALYGAANAQTMLFHNGLKKFETASNGVSIIGNIDLTPSSSDISIIDNSGAALEVKQGSDLYMRFITTNGGEHIEVNKNMEIQGLTATAATFSSTVTVSNGQIVLNGTGRIQGVDTVSASTDAANKAYVDSQIATIPSGLNFQGNWNASTNSPTLTSGSGTPGFYYNVSVAGSTNLDGETDWQVGDWAVFVEAGATDKWEKIDNTSALTGVGVSGRVTFWNGTNTLSSNSNFTYDGNNLAVGGSMTWSGGSSTESNLAYDRSITSFSDSGTSTVTLTIGRQDGNSLSTSFNVPQGTVTGTGSNNRLALWNGTTAIDSNENLSISGNDLAIGTQAGTTTARLLLYGTTANNGASVIKTTNGNLHIDSDDGHSTYVNYYTGTDTGSSLVIGNGASGTSGTFFQATGAATIGGDLTISGGDITLSGTGRIQGVDTVSASTDAANKAYVDAHTSGVQTINEGDGIKKSGTASSVTISANYDSGDSDNLIHAATAVNSINGASSGYAAYVLAAESNPGLAAGPVNKIRVSDIHLDDFGAAEANINLNSNKITNLSTPTVSTDAATKAYVDAVPTGNVSGSGLSTRIAFWSGGSSLTSDQDLTFAVGTNRLSSGNYIIPNNGDYLGTDTSGAARTLITLDNSNNVEISNAALSASSDTNIYFGDNFRIKDGGSTRFSVQSNGTISGNGNTFNSGPINLEEDNKIIFDDDGDQWNYIQATSGDMEMGVGGNGLTLRNIEENIYGEITVNTLRNVVDNFITNSTATYIPVYTSASSSTPQVQRQQTPAKFIENNGIVKGAPGTSGRVAVWTGSGFTNSIGSDTLYWNSTNNVLGVNYSGSTFNSGAVQIQGPTSNSGGIGLQIYNSTSGAPYGAHGIFVNGPRYGNAGISVKNPNVGSTFMRFYSSSGSSVGTISQSGSSSTSYNTSSDYRLKENIEPMSGSIERIKALKPCRFNFIEEEIKDKKGVKRKVDGFLAHEASGVVPEAVTGQKDELDYKGDPEYQSIDQSKLVPLLTSALQEALAKIESLETRLDTLEQKK